SAPALDHTLRAIVAKAAKSSLDAVAWGIAYPDLVRLVSPISLFPKKMDRAWALEQTWRRELTDPDATLLNWSAGVCSGWRPAFIFNATMTEEGRALLFTPIEIKGQHGMSFFEYYPRSDVAIARAVRMSSTFPYVTPVARAHWIHRADSGRRANR